MDISLHDANCNWCEKALIRLMLVALIWSSVEFNSPPLTKDHPLIFFSSQNWIPAGDFSGSDTAQQQIASKLSPSLRALRPPFTPGENHDSRSRSERRKLVNPFLRGCHLQHTVHPSITTRHYYRPIWAASYFALLRGDVSAAVSGFSILYLSHLRERRFRHFLLFICDRCGLIFNFLSSSFALIGRAPPNERQPLRQNTLLLLPLCEWDSSFAFFSNSL